jgi:hypothetical protein
VIHILPEEELREDRVISVNDPVSIAAVFRFVELSQGQEAIGRGGGRLRSKITKQLAPVVNGSISIPIEAKERII